MIEITFDHVAVSHLPLLLVVPRLEITDPVVKVVFGIMLQES